jgi:hypothetical protein
MKKLLILLLLIAAGYLAYRAYVEGGTPGRPRGRSPQKVIKGIVRSGREVGEGAGKAFRSVDFGGD